MDSEAAERMRVRGAVVDDATRCAHYASPLDVVAMRLACCDGWWPCHACHDEEAGHPMLPWPRSRRDEPAVLCGVCRTAMLVEDYLAVEACPACAAPFNPGCSLHHHRYFEL